MTLPKKDLTYIGKSVLFHELKDKDRFHVKGMDLQCFDILSTKESTISFLRNLPQEVVTFSGMGLIMIFGIVLKRETNLLCQGMANKKYLLGWNVKQERFFWGSNPLPCTLHD